MTQRSRNSAVAGAHGIIRVLADGEGPFRGDLVTRHDGVAVRVRADDLHGWSGWAYAGTEHVAAPLDVAYRPDGQDVLLPWCVRTARAHLIEGADQGALPHGEAVTLAVSVLRGVLELADEDEAEARQGEMPDPGSADGRSRADRSDRRGPGGTWWLTDEARPVFAIAPGPAEGAGRTVAEESAELLRALETRVDDRALRRVLTRLIDALAEPRRLKAEAARWERDLLEIAAPRPLRVPAAEAMEVEGLTALHDPSSPRRDGMRSVRRRDLRRGVGDGPGRRGRGSGRAARRPRTQRRPRERPAGLLGRVILQVGAEVRDRAVLIGGIRDRIRPRASGRMAAEAARGPGRRRWRGPALVAVAAAAAIAVAGALWPGDAGTADAADHAVSAGRSMPPAASPGPPAPATASAAGGDPGQDGRPGPSAAPRRPGASAQSDPRAAAEELIAAAQACQSASEPACAQIWDTGTAASRALRNTTAAPVLIEDYGDVAAIRSGSGDQAQMVVIIRRDAGWRIRDVYDIADPPSEGAGAP
ncbi:MAG: hypothetical protein JST33_00905 [Actinobacteria bacterium]|nr:hypothetical protein [Actinomycetota bacterium]